MGCFLKILEKKKITLAPEIVFTYLKKGNQRFLNNLKINSNLLQQVCQTSRDQFPFSTILSCVDPKTSSGLIFDQVPGDIFSIRISGNKINGHILGSMEYACKIAKSKIIVDLGHKKFGAIIYHAIKRGFNHTFIKKTKKHNEHG